ncbi:mitochondrial import inner membrane translocase subunit Tim29-like [Watersipora subatra]|uniref:mitochondrial import inner membrane translocase subunit Tim29-like n=1 Tax=Watersipora subatra TaxID=2589382 RepID=UPI00355C0FB3
MAAPMKSIFKSSRSMFSRRMCTASEAVTESSGKPPKESIKTKIGSYFKRMYADYKFSATETVNLFKEKPIRMSFYTTVAAVTGYFFAHNPSMQDYEAHLATMTCDLAEVSSTLRNEEKSAQIQTLINYSSHGRLRRFTLGVCCFIWVSDYPKYVDLYEAHCKEVQMTWREFPNYIVDIGFLNRWLWSEQYITDFDINPKEWPSEESQAVAS